MVITFAFYFGKVIGWTVFVVGLLVTIWADALIGRKLVTVRMVAAPIDKAADGAI
jgi:hypothetical protein